MPEVPVSIRLFEQLPEACKTCDPAFELCMAAVAGLKNSPDHHIDFAGGALGRELQETCPGPKTYAVGWAVVKKSCGLGST